MKLTVKIYDEQGNEVKANDLRKAWNAKVKAYEEAKKERDELTEKLDEARTVTQETFSQLLMLQSISRQAGLNFELPKQRKPRTKKA